MWGIHPSILGFHHKIPEVCPIEVDFLQKDHHGATSARPPKRSPVVLLLPTLDAELVSFFSQFRTQPAPAWDLFLRQVFFRVALIFIFGLAEGLLRNLDWEKNSLLVE